MGTPARERVKKLRARRKEAGFLEKPIFFSPEALSIIAKQKRPKESYSDVVNRLIAKTHV